MTIHEAVRILRSGRSQEDFARLLGVRAQSISRYERGANPEGPVLLKMLRMATDAENDDAKDVILDTIATKLEVDRQELLNSFRSNEVMISGSVPQARADEFSALDKAHQRMVLDFIMHLFGGRLADYESIIKDILRSANLRLRKQETEGGGNQNNKKDSA